jgi:predicted alpha-1,6-mannanase (GH76 family)
MGQRGTAIRPVRGRESAPPVTVDRHPNADPADRHPNADQADRHPSADQADRQRTDRQPTDRPTTKWADRAADASRALVEVYWEGDRGLFRVTQSPRRLLSWAGPWHYWWQAHALDSLLLAGDNERAARLIGGVLRRNGGRITNDYYDDMAWMGLALHAAASTGTGTGLAAGHRAPSAAEGTPRAERALPPGQGTPRAERSLPAADAAGDRAPAGDRASAGDRAPAAVGAAGRAAADAAGASDGRASPGRRRPDAGGLSLRSLVDELMAQLRAGVHPRYGAVAWRRRDWYLNVAANAPTAILAARTGDRAFAQRLVDWLHATLVTADGVVRDKVNPDGSVDASTWTYNYGTVVGADVELRQLSRAHRVATAAARVLPRADGTLPDEGPGDGALFKGIFARHLGTFVTATGDRPMRDLLVHNAEIAWDSRSPDGLFGPDWSRPPARPVELSAHLSGVLLLHTVAAICRP